MYVFEVQVINETNWPAPNCEDLAKREDHFYLSWITFSVSAYPQQNNHYPLSFTLLIILLLLLVFNYCCCYFYCYSYCCCCYCYFFNASPAPTATASHNAAVTDTATLATSVATATRTATHTVTLTCTVTRTELLLRLVPLSFLTCLSCCSQPSSKHLLCGAATQRCASKS